MRAPEPSGRAARAGLLALLVLTGAVAFAPITNNDIFLHLTTGRLVLETGHVPRVDDYSALARGRPFVAHEWLAGVAFHAVHTMSGWNGLVLFKILLALVIAGTLYAAARVSGASAAIAVPALALVAYLAGARFLERPHLFTYLLTALFLLLLARRRAGRAAPLWLLAVLQIAWANLHGGFILGPVLLGLAAMAAALDGDAAEARRLLVLVPVLIAASLVNPYGADLLRFPFALTGSGFMDRIYEWLPPYTEPFVSTSMARLYAVWTVLAGGILGTALVLRLRRGAPLPGGAFPILLFVAFLGLSLRMNRNVTDYALATAPGVAACATALLGAGRAAAAARRALPPLTALLLLIAGWTAVHGYPYGPGARRPAGFGLGPDIARGAADYLQARGIAGNLFTDYASGAYLVYRFYPRVRVAMDSRNDVYGDTLYLEYARALQDPEALRLMLRHLDAAAIVLGWPREGMVTTAATVRRLRDWLPVYFDDAAVVYLREGGPHDLLARRDGYRILEPSLFRAGSLAPGDAAAALEEAERAVRQGGGSLIARVMRADALLASGRRDEALAEESRLFAEDPPQHIQIHLGLIRLAAGDREGAAGRFRRALALNPASAFARAALEQATGRKAPPPP